jgi:phage I-like protein
MHQEHISLAVDVTSEGEPPREFRIFTKGEVKTRKGAFIFDEQAALDVTAEATEFGNEFPLDYAHSMFSALAPNPAESHKAAGWFKPEIREGELWATSVTWTPDATKYLKNREYRYISPTFEHKDKRVTRLLNVALTNIPASHKLEPLMAHYQGSVDMPEKYREMYRDLPIPIYGTPEMQRALQDLANRPTDAAATATGEIMIKTVALAAGMPAEAAEGEVLSKVTLYREVVSEIGKVTGKDNPREALGTVLAWKEENAKLEAAQAKVAELEGTVRRREVDEKVEEKVRGGFLPPAQRDFAIKLGMHSPEMFEAYLEGLKTKIVNTTSLESAGALPRKPSPGVVVPSAAELAQLHMTEEEYVKTQTKMIESGVL